MFGKSLQNILRAYALEVYQRRWDICIICIK